MKHPANRTPLWKVVGSLLLAFRYYRFAQQDEKNGFRFTSAFEWRKAAELAASLPLLAEHCWQEWERIMRLPRRFAEPITVIEHRSDFTVARPVLQQHFIAERACVSTDNLSLHFLLLAWYIRFFVRHQECGRMRGSHASLNTAPPAHH